jgi:hypothetical protein
MSRLLRILQLRLLWPVLLLLAAFVIFFQFIADVGGSAEPQSSPPIIPLPTASPSPAEQPEPGPAGPPGWTPGPPGTPAGPSLDR